MSPDTLCQRSCVEEVVLAEYSYKALDKTAQEVRGLVVSSSRGAALTDLERQGFVVVELIEGAREEAIPWYRRQLFEGTKVPSADIAETSYLLASLLSSSLPLAEALQISSDSSSNKHLSNALRRMQSGLESGLSIARAFEASGVFPRDFLAFVSGGDSANRLASSLQESGDYFALRSSTKNRVVAALAYPLFLLLVALVVVTLMVFILTPALYSTLEASGHHVGGMIASLEWARVSFAEETIASIGVLAASLIGMGVICWTLWRLALRISPYLLQRQNAASYARVCRVVAALLQSGRPLNEALKEVESLTNGDIKGQVQLAQRYLEEGATSAKAFESGNGTPSLFRRLYGFGERANQLEKVLPLAARVLEEQHKDFLTRVTNLITPLATLVVGSIIGLLVFVMISAVLEVSNVAI